MYNATNSLGKPRGVTPHLQSSIAMRKENSGRYLENDRATSFDEQTETSYCKRTCPKLPVKRYCQKNTPRSYENKLKSAFVVQFGMASDMEPDSTMKCLLCQNFLSDPTTIPCGHNFCMKCITRCWDMEIYSGIYTCPRCKRTLTVRPTLSRNVALANMVQQVIDLRQRVPGAGGDEVRNKVRRQYSHLFSILLKCNGLNMGIWHQPIVKYWVKTDPSQPAITY